MRHRDKHKTVFLCALQLEKTRTNRTYVHQAAFTLIYMLIVHIFLANKIKHKWPHLYNKT